MHPGSRETLLSFRELALTATPFVLLAVGLLALAYWMLDPAPPKTVTLATGQDQGATDGMLLTLRSVANPRAAAIMRDSLERNYQTRLADALPGPDRTGRSALLIAICAGMMLNRTVLGSTVLTGEEAERLIPYLRAALDAVADIQ